MDLEGEPRAVGLLKRLVSELLCCVLSSEVLDVCLCLSAG